MSSRKKSDTMISMKIQTEIPIKRVQDLLCNAFEGGSNYWYLIEEFHKPTRFDHYSWDAPEPGRAQEVFKHLDYPTNPGGYLIVSDAKLEGEIDKVSKRRLNLASIEEGLKVMAEKYPRHFADFMTEHDDAITGDVFLQCCLFGEVVYG